MVQAQKQTGRPIEQNRRPRHKSSHLQPTDLQQRSPKHMMEKRPPLQIMLQRELNREFSKEEVQMANKHMK
jgi:hypothetical protein